VLGHARGGEVDQRGKVAGGARLVDARAYEGASSGVGKRPEQLVEPRVVGRRYAWISVMRLPAGSAT
jgi:hypothetical protein